MIRSLFLSTITAMLLVGCLASTHDFKIRFNDIQGLKTGDQVYLEKTPIGEVEDIEYNDSGFFLVSVSIKEEFASAATDASRFFIDAESKKREQKVIRVVQLEKDGNKIEEGSIVDGQSKYAVIYDQFAYRLGKNINTLESRVNDFFGELNNFSENDQIKGIEKQLDLIIAELGDMSDEMKDNLEKNVLPLLMDKIEELRQRLKKAGEEEKLKHIDQKIEVITDRLQV